jgi:hypothetical protein
VHAAPDILFVRGPDRKTTKSRLRFDLRPKDQGAQVDRLIDLGAERSTSASLDDATRVVMADPEGNEFCVRAARPPEAD